MSDRRDRSMEDQLELYVLNLLDGQEAAEVEQWLSDDPEARERARELRGAASMLALGLDPIDPPAELKSRILEQARADTTPPEPVDITAEREQRSEPAYRSWLPWAVAAVLAIALVSSLIWNMQLQDEVDNRVEVARYPVEVVGGGAEGELLVLQDDDAAILNLEALQQPEPGQVYQVWLIADAQPQPVTTFVPDQYGAANVAIRDDLANYQTLAVTVEPEGGSPQPTTEPFIISDLTANT